MYEPELYEKNKSSTSRDTAQFLPSLISDMEWGQGETILDFGCGAGSTGYKYLVPLVEIYGSKLYSVDISPEMIKHARAHYPDKKMNFMVGDILREDFPLKGKKMDKIFSVYVLMWCREWR